MPVGHHALTTISASRALVSWILRIPATVVDRRSIGDLGTLGETYSPYSCKSLAELSGINPAMQRIRIASRSCYSHRTPEVT